MVNIKAGVTLLLTMVIGLILVVSIYGETVEEVIDASNATSPDFRCMDNGCFWNESRTLDCTAVNTSGNDATQCATQWTAPLDGLFDDNGIIPLMFLGAGLMVVVGLVLKAKME